MSKIRRFIHNSIFSVRITYQAARRFFVLKTLLSMFSSLLPFVNIFIWRDIINLLTDSSQTNRGSILIYRVILYLGVFLVNQFTNMGMQFVEYKYNDHVNFYIDNMLLDKYAQVDLAFYDSSEISDKVSHIWEIKNSIVMLATVYFSIIKVFVTFIVSWILLTRLSARFAIMILILSIPLFWLDYKANRIQEVFSGKNANLNRQLSYFKNLFMDVSNSYDIKLFNLKDFFLGKYAEAWKELFKRRKEVTIKVTLLSAFGLLISTILNQILLYVILIRKITRKLIGIGDVTYFISSFEQFSNSVIDLVSIVSYVKVASEQLVTVREFIDMKPEVQKNGTLVPKDMQEITFSHVCFKYPGTENFVLKDCSFTIKNGQTMGLVGENGSGKSTIVKLLLRLYDVDEGQILLNGVDIREYDIIEYRNMFSVLFQDFIDYGLTLRENIAVADLRYLNDDKKIWDAIEKSELNDVVRDWEAGLETPMTRLFEDDGKELSGGQWQRVALARVFFSNRDLIVLDEPSASLDAFAEEKIFNQFAQLSNNRSSVIISHRLSSIVDADGIIVLKDGKIVEMGSHHDLLRQNGYYAGLFRLQADRYIQQ